MLLHQHNFAMVLEKYKVLDENVWIYQQPCQSYSKQKRCMRFSKLYRTKVLFVPPKNFK